MRGHIRKRGADSFELKYDVASDGGGRRTVYKSFKGSKRQAQVELSRLLTQAAEGTHVDPSKLTIEKYLRTRFEHWKLAKTIGPVTAQRYAELIDLHIVPYIGARPLQRLSTQDIETWHTTLLTRGRKARKGYEEAGGGLSARTVGHCHRLLSKMLNEGMRHGLVGRNVCRLQGAPKTAAKEVAILSPEQVNELPTLLHGHALEAPALISLHTGMRRGELLALRWENVDFEEEKILVRESLEQTRNGLRFKGPKTASGKRDITLPAIVVDILQAHRKRDLERRIGLGQGKPSGRDLVFPAWDGTPWPPNNLSSDWSKLSHELGLGVSFHALRHTHASFLLDLGNVEVVTISKRLGHSSPAVTLAIYAHLIRQDDRKAAHAIDTSLGK
jgi:integrase